MAVGLSLPSLIALGLIMGGLLYSGLARTYVSMQIGLVCVGVFVLQVITGLNVGGTFVSLVTLELGLSHGPGFAGFQPFQPWEPVGALTSIYIHSDLFHLLYNMIALVFFGVMLEDRIGGLRFAAAFYLTGLLGGLGFVLINFNEPAFILVGASAAVSGVFGVFARLYPRLRVSMWLALVPLPPLPIYILFIANILIQFVFSLLVLPGPLAGNVAYEAHIIGSAAGFALGPFFARPEARGAKGRGQRGPSAKVEELRPLALTPELQEILMRVEGETLQDVREAWLARFQQRARCPKCGGELQWSRGDARSGCGWRLRGS